MSEPEPIPWRSAPKRDRVLHWPLVFAVGVPLLLIGLRTTPLAPDLAYVLLGVTSLLAIWGIGAICATIVAVRAKRRKAWRRAISAGFYPGIVLAFVLFGALLRENFIDLAGGFIRLEFLRSFYLASVRAHPVVDGQRVVIFIWKVEFGPSRGVVYDESDEAALPLGRQSAAWHTQADHTWLSCETYQVWPAGGHLYLADFGC